MKSFKLKWKFENIPAICAAVVFPCVTTLFAVWIFKPQWKAFSSASMKVNTSLGFVLASVCLYLIHHNQLAKADWKKISGKILALLVLAVGVVTLFEYVSDINLGVDELLISDYYNVESKLYPGRMSPIAALSFVLLGSSLLGLLYTKKRRAFHVSVVAILPVLTLSLFAAVGYLYGVQSFYKFGPYIRISWQSATAFLLLGTGILFTRPNGIDLTILTSQGLGASMARRVLPLIVFIPIALGGIRLYGQYQGLYDLELGTALRSMSSVILFAILIWGNAKTLQQVDEERSRALKRLSLMFNNAPFPICLVKMPGTIIADVNPAWLSLFEYSREEVIGKSTVELNMHQDVQNRNKIVKDFSETGSVKGSENIMYTKSRKPRVTANFIDPLQIENEDYALVTLVDVTDQKLTQKALQEAVRARDEFLSIASHELKTPLTSLKLKTQVARKQLSMIGESAFPKEKLEKMISSDLIQIDRMGRLVDDMLDISRISSGKLTVQKDVVELGDAVKGVLERHRPQFDQEGRSISLDVSEPIYGNWDRLRIEQVVANLLTNALKYGDGKPVTVEVRKKGSQALISVADQGIGIAPENLTRIFDRFERAVSNEASGLGLGLYIVKKIVLMHGGDVKVESKLGVGSTFTVELPL